MPRKNHKRPQKFIRFEMNTPRSDKKRYPNERAAREAADYLELTRGIELEVYRDIDGGWYLTRKK